VAETIENNRTASCVARGFFHLSQCPILVAKTLVGEAELSMSCYINRFDTDSRFEFHNRVLVLPLSLYDLTGSDVSFRISWLDLDTLAVHVRCV